jgi:hypothetical protein
MPQLAGLDGRVSAALIGRRALPLPIQAARLCGRNKVAGPAPDHHRGSDSVAVVPRTIVGDERLSSCCLAFSPRES